MFYFAATLPGAVADLIEQTQDSIHCPKTIDLPNFEKEFRCLKSSGQGYAIC